MSGIANVTVIGRYGGIGGSRRNLLIPVRILQPYQHGRRPSPGSEQLPLYEGLVLVGEGKRFDLQGVRLSQQAVDVDTDRVCRQFAFQSCP
jgi:hypothetical protein